MSLPPRKICAVWILQFAGVFHFQNALLSTNFESTGRLHYFSAIHKVRAHASYMGVSFNHCTMWNPFRKKKQDRELTEAEVKDLKLHVAGSTVRHKNFDHLTYFKNSDQLSGDFIDKWVSPFYMTNLASEEYSKNLQLVSDELTEEIVEKLLGDFNWRMRIVGATFSAIKNYQKFEQQIGTLLLKSEVTYAADGYVVALATFNTSESVKFFSQYLDHYLRKKDLWFDQNDVMAALKWLDHQNETNEHTKFLELWNKFISNKQNLNLNSAYLNFEKEMMAIKKLSEIAKN